MLASGVAGFSGLWCTKIRKVECSHATWNWIRTDASGSLPFAIIIAGMDQLGIYQPCPKHRACRSADAAASA